MHGQPTPGITEPKLTAGPLGTEGEMTPGPDDQNPFDEIEAERQAEAFDPLEPFGQPPATHHDVPLLADNENSDGQERDLPFFLRE